MAATSVLTSVLPSAAVEEPKPDSVKVEQATVAVTPQITGTKCTKSGVFRTAKTVRYQCRKSAQGLRWIAAPSKTSSPTSSTTTTTTEPYRQSSNVSSNLDLCRLTDRSTQRLRHGWLGAGFPRIESNFEAQGTFKVAMIPIDFADSPGDTNVATRIADQMKLVSDWYDTVSESKVAIQWQTHNSWVRVSGNSTNFALNRSRSDDNRLAQAAFLVADPLFDFTNVRAVAFVLPAGQTFMAESVQGFRHSEFGSSGGYATAEGRIYNYMIAGAYFDRQYKAPWTYWAHEMGHMFPLPDLYDQTGQWWIGKVLEIPGGPFSGFDMMANQDGPSRTLGGWLRFVMGWLTDSQVFCKPFSDLTSTQLMLAPIDDRRSGLKAVMIPISETKLIVVESRRHNKKFDCANSGESTNVWRGRNGVIVYTADMTLGHGEGFQTLVAPSGRGLHSLATCSAPPQLDALLQTGDSVVTNGVKISVVKSATYDTIEITKP